MWSLCALCIGFGIDLILGDPRCVPHPVVFIGRLISALEKLLRRLFPKTVRGENAAGGVLWKARKCYLVAAGTEDITLRQDICRYRIQNGFCHLTRHKTAPDQLIQLVLFRCQEFLNVIRYQIDIGRTDGFMRIL